MTRDYIEREAAVKRIQDLDLWPMDINEVARHCEYFLIENGCNCGYGCGHPDNGDRQLGAAGSDIGTCSASYCPLGVPAIAEDGREHSCDYLFLNWPDAVVAALRGLPAAPVDALVKAALERCAVILADLECECEAGNCVCGIGRDREMVRAALAAVDGGGQ